MPSRQKATQRAAGEEEQRVQPQQQQPQPQQQQQPGTCEDPAAAPWMKSEVSEVSPPPPLYSPPPPPPPPTHTHTHTHTATATHFLVFISLFYRVNVFFLNISARFAAPPRSSRPPRLRTRRAPLCQLHFAASLEGVQSAEFRLKKHRPKKKKKKKTKLCLSFFKHFFYFV